MSHLNLLNISKEINNIKNVLEELSNNYKNLNKKYENITTKILDLNEFQTLDFINISDEIKLDLKELKYKIEDIEKLNLDKNLKENTNNHIFIFLKNLNIEEAIIYKYIFLNCEILEDLITIDKNTCVSFGIPENTYDLIKNKTQTFIYNNHNKVC